MERKHVPEILAPAGTKESLEAAVKAGADAVYLGGALYSARAFAGNFDKEALLEALDYCHLNSVRVYMTVNTLLKEEELDCLPGFMEPFYLGGVDGIIVQDTGAARILAREYPDLPMHGSTQMSISSRYGAQLLKDLGMTRVVPARELSLNELKSIREHVDIELETFVHGAMCFSFSGKCLFSSYLGGRSGNRGRCAQPCRQRYERNGARDCIMSLKDMCTLEILPKLIDAGIDSFKIEGRMKKPEYVAGAVSAYREARDAYLSGEFEQAEISERIREQQDIYNRGGFSRGYYEIHNGPSMLSGKRPNHTGVRVGQVERVMPPQIGIGLSADVNPQDILEIRTDAEDAAKCVELTCSVSGRAGSTIRLNAKELKKIKNGMEVYRTRNQALLTKIRKEIIEPERTQEVCGFVRARIGEALEVRLTDPNGEVSAAIQGEIVSPAREKPVTGETVQEKMGKTGGTGFRIRTECDIQDGAFFQMSSFNGLRRQVLEDYRLALLAKWYRPENPICGEEKSTAGNIESLDGITVRVKTADQMKAVTECPAVSRVITDENLIRTFRGCAKPLFVAMPDILREENIRIVEEELERAITSGISGIVIKNLDELGLLVRNCYQGHVILDSFLYAYNNEAVEFYRQFFDRISVLASEELTLEEFGQMKDAALFTYKAYGRQQLMVTAQCMKKNGAEGCDHAGSRILRFADDRGEFFAVNDCRYCYSTIYNGLPTDMLDRMEELPSDRFLLDFTVESGAETRSILDRLASGDRPSGNFTRGHYYKGID